MTLLEPVCLDSRNAIRSMVPLYYCPGSGWGYLWAVLSLEQGLTILLLLRWACPSGSAYMRTEMLWGDEEFQQVRVIWTRAGTD